LRLHRKIAEEMERVWGERAAEHAAEVAYQYWRGAEASGAGRGVEYAIAAADNAESAYAFDEVAAFLRIVLDLLPANDPRRPRLLARQALALTWSLDEVDAVKVATEAAALIAAAESPDSAAEFLENAARSMLRAGLMRCSWELAKEGLRYTGERRDIVWASLDELDAYRADADDPANPGITVDSPRLRQRWAAVREITSGEDPAYRFVEFPYDSRQEIIDKIVQDPDNPHSAQVFLGGDCRRGLPLWQEKAADAERSGRIALAMESWALVARIHITLGDFTAARAAYDRAIGFALRFNRPSLQLLNLIEVRYDFLFALDHGWDEIAAVPGEVELLENPPPNSDGLTPRFARPGLMLSHSRTNPNQR
jgi:tetratricopeptide (TPR) repeat protein